MIMALLMKRDCSNAGKPDLEIIVSTANRLVIVLTCKVVKFHVWFHLSQFCTLKLYNGFEVAVVQTAAKYKFT